MRSVCVQMVCVMCWGGTWLVHPHEETFHHSLFQSEFGTDPNLPPTASPPPPLVSSFMASAWSQYLDHFLAVSGSVLHCRTWVCNVFKLQCETEGTSKPSTGCYFTLHVTFKYLLSLWVMIHCLLRSKPDLCFMNFMASLKNILLQLGRMSQHVQVNNN